MDAYLERFERYASNQRWPTSAWAINLGALLQGRALDVYSRLSPEEAGKYSELKQALLKRFQMSAEDFQHTFRTAEPEPGESARQYAVYRLGEGKGRDTTSGCVRSLRAF